MNDTANALTRSAHDYADTLRRIIHGDPDEYRPETYRALMLGAWSARELAVRVQAMDELMSYALPENRYLERIRQLLAEAAMPAQCGCDVPHDRLCPACQCGVLYRCPDAEAIRCARCGSLVEPCEGDE